MPSSDLIPAVSTAVFKEDKVLIVLRAKGAAKDRWSLPGGHIKSNETPETAAAREVYEETGITCKIISNVTSLQIPVADNVIYHLSVFSGMWEAGQIKAASDAADAQWIDPSGLSGLPSTDNLESIVNNARNTILDRQKLSQSIHQN